MKLIRSKSRTLLIVKAAILIATVIIALYASSSGPLPGHTGGFGEPTCQRCHEFGPGPGSFSITGVPAQYTAGQVYPITVQISQPGQSRWGFQLAVRFQAGGTQAGNIQATDFINTQTVDQAGIRYIEHTSIGTRAGTPDGPVSWTFNWVAPEASGPVQFNAAGNAADNDGTPRGDFIYTDERVTFPAPLSFCISGRVATQDGSGLGGVTVVATGPSSGQDVTRPDGSYSVCNLTDGAYTVSPSRDGVTFDPPSRVVTVPPSPTEINFTGTTIIPTDCISGRALQDGVGIGGVTVTATGPSSGQDVTRPDGGYGICNLTAGTYTVAPSRDGLSFDPPSRGVTVPPSQTEINFTASSVPVWSAWERIGGELASAPAAAAWGPNRLDVFAAGTDGSLLHAFWNGTSWNGWENLGNVLTANPAAVSWGPERVDVFIRGLDNAVWQRAWQGAWSDWMNLGGNWTSGPAAASRGPNRLDVIIQGLDNSLSLKVWEGGWSDWMNLGGNWTAAPAAASWGPNRLDVFTRGLEGGLWHRAWEGGWSDWMFRGGVLASSPAAASWGPNRLDVFMIGPDNALYHLWWDGTSWNGWENLGGNWASAPAATSWGLNRLDVFVLGSDNALWHRWLGR